VITYIYLFIFLILLFFFNLIVRHVPPFTFASS